MSSTCFGCGQPRECEVFDAWNEPGGGMNFEVSTCCSWSHAQLIEDYNQVARLAKGREGKQARRSFARWWAAQTGELDGRLVGTPWDGILVAAPLAIVRCGPGADPTDHRVRGQREIKSFVREHHRHASAPPAGWRWGYTIWAGDQMIGVAMVGRPAARGIDGDAVIDVSRICIPTEVPSQVRENACSMVYAQAARDGRSAGFRRLITYSIEGEPAVGCRAAGMEIEHRSQGGTWDTPSRRRKASGNSTQRKVRWGFDLGIGRGRPGA